MPKGEICPGCMKVNKGHGRYCSSCRSRASRVGFKATGDGDFEITVEAPEKDPVVEFEERQAESRDRRAVKQLVEQLRETKARVAFVEELARHRAPPKILRRERASGVREMTAVVLASDWHVEETVDPAGIAYRNAYNLEIAERRIARFFGAIAWNIEHQRASGRIAIRDLVLWLGGDLMTGYIHEELVESNALSPTETILWLAPKLRDGISTLLETLKLDRIEVPCSYGNHGRTTEKSRISTGYANSFEWLMYNNLASEFRKEKRMHFEITASGHQYVEVYDQVLHFHHGDDVKYNGGIGGLAIPLMKRIPMWERTRPANVHNIGHFHQLKDFGRAVVNGSLIGYNAYAQRIGADFEPPQQAMYYMDSKRGKTMSTPLWVESSEATYR